MLQASHSHSLGPASDTTKTAKRTCKKPPNEVNSHTVKVSGIYQDVTAGGYTAKLADRPDSAAAQWVMLIRLVPDADPIALAKRYRSDQVSALPMTAYVAQTLSYVTRGLETATWLSCLTAAGMLTLIISLFSRLQSAREQSRTTTLTVLGFPAGHLRADQMIRMLLPAGLGIVLGVATALIGGPLLSSAFFAMSGVGIVELQFLPAGWLVYGVIPMLLICAALIGSHFSRDLGTSDRQTLTGL